MLSRILKVLAKLKIKSLKNNRNMHSKWTKLPIREMPCALKDLSVVFRKNRLLSLCQKLSAAKERKDSRSFRFSMRLP